MQILKSKPGKVTPLAARDPAAVYLAMLAASGRRAMETKLRTVRELLTREFGPLAWSALRFEHVAAVAAKLQEAGRAPATVNATLAAIRGVARAAWMMGQMSADEYAGIKSVRAVRGSRLLAGRALSAGEIAALLGACARDETAAGARDVAFIALLFCGGLRRSEAAAVDVNDYETATGVLRVRGKGNKERAVYLTGGAALALADWLAVRGAAAGPLLTPVRKGGRVQMRRITDQAIYYALLKRAREAHIKRCSPHDLRRTLAGDLLDAGADIAAVQRLLGHANVDTTARYDRRGDAATRKAAELIHLPYQARVREPTKRGES